MRILVVHNFYARSAPSGENKVVEDEIRMLKYFGNDVDTFFLYNDKLRKSGFIGKFIASFSYIFNFYSLIIFKIKIKKFKPNVIHVHNIFPLISPSIFYFTDSRIPFFYTLHNYRLFCANALPYRSGKICTKCIDKNSVFPALFNSCYRKNILSTLPIAINIFIYNNILSTWKNRISGFIVFSEFQKNLILKTGIHEDKIHIKSNFVKPIFSKISWHNKLNYFVYVGRLTKEKGISTLIEAWKIWGKYAPELRVIGDGFLFEELKYKSTNLNIKFLGKLDDSSVQFNISNSKLLIIPSECIEGCPLSLIEAFAYGTPVAVSNLGPLPDFVLNENNGIVFEQMNPLSLFQKISDLLQDENKLEQMGDNCYRTFLNNYDIIANYTKLKNIYNTETYYDEIN
jgi:glycosyltransferase involved in cell wall biosynthesis